MIHTRIYTYIYKDIYIVIIFDCIGDSSLTKLVPVSLYKQSTKGKAKVRKVSVCLCSK